MPSSPLKPSFASRMVRLGGILVLQFVVFFVLLEIVGRIIDPIGISYYDETARMFDSMIIEEPIGYRFPPNLEDDFYGVPVKINELGLRERPIGKKAPNEFRIMAIGDSVIFSVGVAYEDSIPAQIERMANADATNGRVYRTLNMGVPSYNTLQQLEQLRQVGLDLEADAAFLFIIPNDIQEKMWVYEKRGGFFVDTAQRSYAAGLLFYAARYLANMVGFSTNPNRTSDRDADYKMVDVIEPESEDSEKNIVKKKRVFDLEKVLSFPGWRNIEDSVLEINRLLKQRDIPLVVFYRTNFRTSYVGRLRQLGEQEGFAAIGVDVFRDPRWADLDRSKYANSPVDSHCNPAGCELYATVLYEGLLEAGVLDKPAR